MSVLESGRGEVPFGIEGMLCTAYVYAGQPERHAEWCRSRVHSGRDTHSVSRIALIISLALARSHEEAIAATTGLIEAVGPPAIRGRSHTRYSPSGAPSRMPIRSVLSRPVAADCRLPKTAATA